MHDDVERVERERLTELSDGRTVAELGRIRTPKGERLAIRIPGTGDEIWLDALGLESVSWQDGDVFEELVDEWGDRRSIDPQAPATPVSDRSDWDHLDDFRNEYAIVSLFRVGGEDGDRLAIESKRLGYSVVLTATELGSLAAHDSSLLSEFLVTPFGPE